MRPEHNFAVTLDEWEEAVIKNAAYFTVVKRTAINTQAFEKSPFPDFPSALKAAKRNKLPALIYAITKSERSCVVVEKHWPLALQAWLDKHPPKKRKVPKPVIRRK